MLLESNLLNDEKFDNWWLEFGNLGLEIPQDFLVTLKCLWLVDLFKIYVISYGNFAFPRFWSLFLR